MKHFESYKRKKKTCIECEEPIISGWRWHPSGLCRTCYDTFKQRLRDNEVQGSE